MIRTVEPDRSVLDRYPRGHLTLVLISIILFLSGCAGKDGGRAGHTEELLGQEVKEGRVIEGTIEARDDLGGFLITHPWALMSALLFATCKPRGTTKSFAWAPVWVALAAWPRP